MNIRIFLLLTGLTVIGTWILLEGDRIVFANTTAAAASAPTSDTDTTTHRLHPDYDAEFSASPIPANLIASHPVQGSTREPVDHVDARTRIDANIAALDRRFVAEPLNTAWAARTQGQFAAFFDPAALAAAGLSAPTQLQARCHSNTCRIHAQYSDAISAELATQHLAMHLASQLPYGAVMPRQLEGGSIEVNAWYSATRIDL